MFRWAICSIAVASVASALPRRHYLMCMCACVISVLAMGERAPRICGSGMHCVCLCVFGGWSSLLPFATSDKSGDRISKGTNNDTRRRDTHTETCWHTHSIIPHIQSEQKSCSCINKMPDTIILNRIWIAQNKKLVVLLNIHNIVVVVCSALTCLTVLGQQHIGGVDITSVVPNLLWWQSWVRPQANIQPQFDTVVCCGIFEHIYFRFTPLFFERHSGPQHTTNAQCDTILSHSNIVWWRTHSLSSRPSHIHA